MLATSNRFVIVARCVITNPAERARRLRAAYAVFEQRKRKETADMGNVCETEPTSAAGAELSEQPNPQR